MAYLLTPTTTEIEDSGATSISQSRDYLLWEIFAATLPDEGASPPTEGQVWPRGSGP